MQRSEDLGLYVYDEEDNETILLHRVSSDDIYRKQEGNLQLYTLYLYITHTHINNGHCNSSTHVDIYSSLHLYFYWMLLLRFNNLMEGPRICHRTGA